VDARRGPCHDLDSIPKSDHVRRTIPVRHHPLLRPSRIAACALSLALSPWSVLANVPPHSHVVVVVMENKSYDQVRVQPYAASLMAAGATLTNSYAVTHPSQPNYIALWCALTLGVTNDVCPAPGSPYAVENLGHACEAAGKTWRAYSENLPSPGATGCSYDGNTSTGLYTRKHDPWSYCSNLDHLNERPYSDLATDIAAGALPNLAFIIPNNCHNTHNSSTVGCGVADGDAWLAANLPLVLTALGPDGVLILTWDEDDGSLGNHVLTVFVGPHVIPGAQSTGLATHYTVTRTICDLLGLPSFGLAANEAPVSDIWDSITPTRPGSWGRMKTIYR
jgi:phospholipase C